MGKKINEKYLPILKDIYAATNGVFKQDTYMPIAEKYFSEDTEKAIRFLNHLHKLDCLFIDKTRLFGDNYVFRKWVLLELIEPVDLGDIILPSEDTNLKRVPNIHKDSVFDTYNEILQFIYLVGKVIFQHHLELILHECNQSKKITNELVDADLLKLQESKSKTGEYVYVLKKGALTRLKGKEKAIKTSSVSVTSQRELLSYYKLATILERIEEEKKEKEKEEKGETFKINSATSPLDFQKKFNDDLSNIFYNKNNASAYMDRLIEYYTKHNLPIGHNTSPVFMDYRDIEIGIETARKTALSKKDKAGMKTFSRKKKIQRNRKNVIDWASISALMQRNVYIGSVDIQNREQIWRTETTVTYLHFLISDKTNIGNIVKDIELNYYLANAITIALFSGMNSSVGGSSGTFKYIIYTDIDNIETLIKELKTTCLKTYFNGTPLFDVVTVKKISCNR